MIKLTNLSMPLRFTEDILRQKIAQRLHISAQEIQSVLYLKRSVDARKKPKITVILTVAVAVLNEEKILRRTVKDADIQSYVPYYYRIPKCTVPVSQANRPVIVGFGPAGMFAALVLAKAGLRPIVLERGKCVEQRQEDVANFRKTGVLCTESNVQFGEGGAGP